MPDQVIRTQPGDNGQRDDTLPLLSPPNDVPVSQIVILILLLSTSIIFTLKSTPEHATSRLGLEREVSDRQGKRLSASLTKLLTNCALLMVIEFVVREPQQNAASRACQGIWSSVSAPVLSFKARTPSVPGGGALVLYSPRLPNAGILREAKQTTSCRSETSPEIRMDHTSA